MNFKYTERKISRLHCDKHLKLFDMHLMLLVGRGEYIFKTFYVEISIDLNLMVLS